MRILLCICLMGLFSCNDSRSSGGIVVRQVLHGEKAQAAAPADPASTAAVAQPVPGMSLGSTLVSDSSQAIYRRAYDQSRRRSDGDSARERLGAIDAQLDQEQEIN